MVAERLTGFERDQDSARRVVGAQHDRRAAPSRSIDLAEGPALHSSDPKRASACASAPRRLSAHVARGGSLRTRADWNELLRRARGPRPVGSGRHRSRCRGGATSTRARAYRRAMRRDPDHARPLRPSRRRRGSGRSHGRTGPHGGGRASVARGCELVHAARATAPPLYARRPPCRRRGARARGDDVRNDSRPGSFSGAPRVPRRRIALLGRRPVCRLGGTHRPSRRKLGHARRVDPRACRPVSARDHRVSGPRSGDDARRRAGTQSVPLRTSRVTKFEAPRGTHDILPSEQPRWRWLMDEMATMCALYGYRRIDTPGIEDTELIVRTSGGGSDIVQKETYTFEDRGGRSLTMRPEATAPICRAYLEHGLHREPQPQKLYTIGPFWRYDRPQRGRYREHWQLSVEAIGTDDPAIDAEVIQLYDELLGRVGVRDYTLELNSIGDRNCRPAYLERLTAWLDDHDAELDDETRAKRKTTPLRVFDVKSERVQAVLARAPKIGESLCDACRDHFARAREYLDAYGVRYELVPTLVRGLDYYTRTTFEFKDEAIGAKDTISGGGRYDGLIEEIGGPPTPGIGFGSGMERVLLTAEALGVTWPLEARRPVFVATLGESTRLPGLKLLAELRAAGIAAETDYLGRSLKAQ